MERKYSLEEIDAMRKSVDLLSMTNSSSFDGAEHIAKVEARLRTYMANGTTPEELAAAARQHLMRLHEGREYMRKRGFSPA